MSVYDDENANTSEDDQIILNIEEQSRRYSEVDSLIGIEFKQWLISTKGSDEFTEEILLEYVKFKTQFPDPVIALRTLHGWLEYDCVQKTEKGFKFLI
jgi:hypothetical protein